MLAGLFRGAFIIGILAWYSISVWKMIDGYFRDQFASYLHEEYRKNPHMRKANNDDTKKGAVNVVGKNDVQRTDMDLTLNRIDELESAESCPVDNVENGDLSESCVISVKISKVDGRTNDDDDDHDDDDSVGEEISKRRNSTGNDESNDVDDGKDVDKDDDDDERRRTMKCIEKMADEERRPIKKDEEFLSSKEFEEEIEMKRERERKREEKKRRRRKRKEEEEEEEDEEEEERAKRKKKKKKKKKMKRVKTITLNEEDFLSVKNRRGHPTIIGRDEDFWEFEEDEEIIVGNEEKGILISDLPFKPKLDVGRLERITPDEYCPLTLDDDDELSCDETTEWP